MEFNLPLCLFDFIPVLKALLHGKFCSPFEIYILIAFNELPLA